MSQAEESKKPQFSILLLLISFATVGAVLFTPALPAITSFFNVSVGQGQLTVTAYLLGYALGQLPYGPLANRFGRKKTLYIGISISIIGSLLCAFSAMIPSFAVLVFARFLQAFGACVGLKISFTMIADACDQTESTKMISRLMIAFAILPGIAVAIGGGLTSLLGWTGCFYFLALFGLFGLWCSSRLPETVKSVDVNALQFSSIVRGYEVKFKNRRLVKSGLIMGLGTASIYIFATKAPFIGIDTIGLTPERFGIYNLIPAFGMVIGGFLSSKLAGRITFFKMLLFGIIGCFAMNFAILIPFSLGRVNPLTLFVPIFLVNVFECLVFANISSFGLANAKNKSNGSAILNFINLGIAVVGVLLVELIYPESSLLLPLSFLICFSAMFVLWFQLKRMEGEA